MIDIIPSKYDPKSYWNQREQPNTEKSPGISDDHRNFFRIHSIGMTSVLEIGPGVGRLFPLYASMTRVACLDLSKKYELEARASARNNGIPLEQFFLDDALQEYPFKSAEFDLAIASFVLLHVPFENIKHTLGELARVCKKLIVFDGDSPEWPSNEDERKPSSHCFRHDHDKICADLAIIKTQTQKFEGGSIGFAATGCKI